MLVAGWKTRARRSLRPARKKKRKTSPSWRDAARPLANARFPASPKRSRPSRRKHPFDGRRRLGRQVSWLAGLRRRSAFPVAQWPESNAGSPLTVAGTATACDQCCGLPCSLLIPTGGTVLLHRLTGWVGDWQSGTLVPGIRPPRPPCSIGFGRVRRQWMPRLALEAWPKPSGHLISLRSQLSSHRLSLPTNTALRVAA